jgi:hypothetical protein
MAQVFRTARGKKKKKNTKNCLQFRLGDSFFTFYVGNGAFWVFDVGQTAPLLLVLLIG